MTIKQALKLDFEELIKIVCDNDIYNECISEEELLEIIYDRLRYGFYGQAKALIDTLCEQRYKFGEGKNYWKNDCGTIIPLLTEQDVLDNFEEFF